MKLDFFVPGFSKCGTTTLCSLLSEHPDVFIPPAKEPRFFSDPDYMRRWKGYMNLFRDTETVAAVGEGTTFYSTETLAKESCERILKHFPKAKFIFIARDPIARIESSYREFHNSGLRFGVHNLPLGLGELLKAKPSIVHDTLYWARISEYRERVADKNIHIMFLEDLKAQPAEALARCFAFLGVDARFEPPDVERQLNSGKEKYHDSRVQRLISASSIGRLWLSKLSIQGKNKYRRLLGSRKAFQEPVQWDVDTVRWVAETVVDDARTFLAFCGKPRGYWKRLDNLSASVLPV